MKRIYHHYERWEDYKNGMYIDSDNEELIIKAIQLLSNQELFLTTAKIMLEQWSNSAEVQLSNPHRNKQAWLGQASCCFLFKVPENLTKEAWRRLDDETRIKANKTADIVIFEWKLARGELYG